ncbi:hypothetical protein Bbelb_345700 [Branchiostoma belcheri]|nr:hypothetical protein Bbelb_345700 [Branchiostoma belcheri]
MVVARGGVVLRPWCLVGYGQPRPLSAVLTCRRDRNGVTADRVEHSGRLLTLSSATSTSARIDQGWNTWSYVIPKQEVVDRSPDVNLPTSSVTPPTDYQRNYGPRSSR